MQDIREAISPATSLVKGAQTASDDGTTVSLQGYNAVAWFIEVGTITDGTHTPKIQESDDGSTWTDAPMSAVVYEDDTLSALPALESDTNMRVGYNGIKPYVRCSTVVAGATTGGVYGVTAVRGKPNRTPAAY